MAEMSYIMFGKDVIGRMPDHSVGVFKSVKRYRDAYRHARRKLEDEIADEMFRLENEFEIDDLHLDYICGVT